MRKRSLKDLGKFLNAINKVDGQVFTDNYGQSYTFGDAAKSYEYIKRVVRGVEQPEVHGHYQGRTITDYDMAVNLVAYALYEAVKLRYITDDQVNDQFVADCLPSKSLIRKAQRDVLSKVMYELIFY